MLLLEAGIEGSDFFWSRVPVGVSKMIDDPAVNWCYRSEPDEGSGGRRIDVPRGKMLGGSSSINGMVYHPRPGAGLRPLGAARQSRLELSGRAADLQAHGAL